MAQEKNTEPNVQNALFALGCFWCGEKPFDHVNGVLETTSGYAGGAADTATYDQVSRGRTGHVEVLQVTYDANKVTYQDLLDIFWVNIDPFDDRGQFCDKGHHYRAAIYVNNQQERSFAEASLQEKEDFLGKKIVTEVREIQPFYKAEEYHQDYYKKNPIRYKFYRAGCGRDTRLRQVWGDLAAH